MSKNFTHTQFAHCESGVVSKLISDFGFKISEPMIFGITSTLTFAYLPIIKINNLPLIAYRSLPKNIINKIQKTLGITIYKKQYQDLLQANLDLTRLVEIEQKLVGLQTSVFYLPYMPADMRFHFNAHNLLVYSKKDQNYKISDPVFEEVVECPEKDLTKARFAKGAFAPKGFLYYPISIPKNIDLAPIISKSIIKTAKSMTTKFPFAGVKGMRTLAKKITKLQNKDERYVKNYLTHIVRMQEEIGTGGGGFRFLYAAFLQEAAGYDLDKSKLEEASELMTKSGDVLREFALKCVESSKKFEKFDAKLVASILVKASEVEEEAYKILKTI
ncbi:MAG: VanZ family protein [Rickettsiales bacterium]|jgi:VanZ family protein